MKIPGAASAAHLDWLAATLKAGDTVAVDGTVLALAGGRALEAALTVKGVRLRTDLDILADVWPDRASLPIPPIYEHVATVRDDAARHEAGGGARSDAQGAAPPITSSRRSTTSRGSRTCAAPTSATTRCSSRTCCSTRSARSSSSPTARSKTA